MSSTKRVPDEVLTRLAMYHDVLVRLEDAGVRRVRSQELARECNVRGDRVRADLSRFDRFGIVGHGYDVHVLRINLGRVLRVETPRKAVLIGTGASAEAFLLGVAAPSALVEVVGVFGAPGEGVAGRMVGGRSVEPFDVVAGVVQSLRVRFGVVATEPGWAQETVDALQLVGVVAVLNVSGGVVRCPSGVVVETASPMLSFKRLSFLAPRRGVRVSG